MHQAEPWRQELHHWIRAFSGSFLFGMPLLFTMETWFIGAFADLGKLLILLLLAGAVNVFLAYVAGFKFQRVVTPASALGHALQALAVGLLGALVVLLVLNRLAWDEPLHSLLGKLVMQIVPLSIGASLANAVFDVEEIEKQQEELDAQRSHWALLLHDVGAMVGGGIFIGFSLTPTTEIRLLASELDAQHELALIALTFVLSYLIVYQSGFQPHEGYANPSGVINHPLLETLLAYAVAVLVAATALFLFDLIALGDPPGSVLSQIVVLAFPTAIGGAAGRLLL